MPSLRIEFIENTILKKYLTLPLRGGCILYLYEYERGDTYEPKRIPLL